MKKAIVLCLLLCPMFLHANTMDEQPDIIIEGDSDVPIDVLGASQKNIESENIANNVVINGNELSFVIKSERFTFKDINIVGFMDINKRSIGQIIPNVFNESQLSGIYLKRENDLCFAVVELTGKGNNENIASIASIKFEGLSEDINFIPALPALSKTHVSKSVELDCNYFQTYDTLPNVVNKIIIKKT